MTKQELAAEKQWCSQFSDFTESLTSDAVQQCNPNGLSTRPKRDQERWTQSASQIYDKPPARQVDQADKLNEQRTANSEQRTARPKLWFVLFLLFVFFCYLGMVWEKIQCHGARQNSVSQESPHNVKVERTRSPSYKLDQVGYQCRDRWGTGGHASESERVETVGNLKLNGLNGSPEHVLTVLGSSGSSNRKCTQHQTQAKHRPRTNCHKFQTKLKDNAAQIRETKGTMPRVQKTSKKNI
jgi:hypothetical protein